jgi:hypothetical protein
MLFVLFMSWAAPERSEASCGDYLHYGESKSLPEMPKQPCHCQGSECHPTNDSPALPERLAERLLDEFGELHGRVILNRSSRFAFRHPVSSRDQTTRHFRSVDPPPRVRA